MKTEANDPLWVIDGEGDRWERQADGKYQYVGQTASVPRSLDAIEVEYGIAARGPSS